MKPMFEKIGIIGAGLIGSSIARAAHKAKLTDHIALCDINEVSLAFARKAGFVDSTTSDPGLCVKACDLVLIAVPIQHLADIGQRINAYLRKNAIVMDVASVKEAAISALIPHLPSHVHFVPAHPIAGSEQSGISAGRANLFEKKRIIITPADPLDAELMQQITRFWRALGARVEGMPAALHDMLYAYISHLPQLLSFAIHHILPQPENPTQSFQTFSRLQMANPQLWAGIFIYNKSNILKALDRYLDVASHIERELANAPASEISGDDIVLAHYQLFPQLAASCLVTTVMEAEKQAGFSFARFAGGGFADFTLPATESPENTIEHISAQFKLLAGLLDAYILKLKQYRQLIATGLKGDLEKSAVSS